MQHWKPFAATALVGIEWDFAIRQPLLAVFTKLWKCSKQAYLLSCLFFFASPSPCFPFSRCYLFSLLQKEKSCSHSGKDHKVGHFENRVKMHWQRKMRSIKSGVGRKEGRKEVGFQCTWRSGVQRWSCASEAHIKAIYAAAEIQSCSRPLDKTKKRNVTSYGKVAAA